MIENLPDEPSPHPYSGTIAARLIALLPRAAHSNIPPHATMIGASEVINFRAGIYMCVAFIVFTIAAQWIVASDQPPAQSDNPDAPASSTVAPPPPNSGQ